MEISQEEIDWLATITDKIEQKIKDTEDANKMLLESMKENATYMWNSIYEMDSAEKSFVKSSCPRCNKGRVLNEIDSLFTCLGYSAPENGKGCITIGYKVDHEAISEYESITEKTLKYGVFVVLKDKLGENDIFSNDGTASEGVVDVEITAEFNWFDLKIDGFTSEQKDVKLAMGAYVSVTDENGTEYSYIQSGEPQENEKYCFHSFNDVLKMLSEKQ